MKRWRPGDPGLPVASEKRIQQRADFVQRLRVALIPAMDVFKEARDAGFSFPFLIDGEEMMQDECFWHRTDRLERRETLEQREERMEAARRAPKIEVVPMDAALADGLAMDAQERKP